MTTAPPGTTPTIKAAAPEHHRVGRNKPPAPGLTRAKRDAVAHLFMAEFPGMSGAEAVRRARDWLTEPDRCVENLRRDGLRMTDDFVSRLMATAPFARKRPKVRACDPRKDGRRQA